MKKNKKTVVWVIVFTILLSLSAMAFLACGNGKKHYTLSAPEAEHVLLMRLTTILMYKLHICRMTIRRCYL